MKKFDEAIQEELKREISRRMKMAIKNKTGMILSELDKFLASKNFKQIVQKSLVDYAHDMFSDDSISYYLTRKDNVIFDKKFSKAILKAIKE